MLGCGLIIALTLAAAPKRRSDPADEAFAEARAAYKMLKSDPVRRRFRHHWLNVAGKFDRAFFQYPNSGRAPEALFAAAELYAELSQISRAPEDLHSAVADYRQLVSQFPKSSRADEATLALAKIQLERLDDPVAARATLEKRLKGHPNGNHAVRAMLGSLPKTKPRLQRKAPDPTEPDSPTAPTQRIAQMPSRKGHLSMSESVGLKARRVVIDPGHGGHDSGAIGRAGTREKDVALKIAKRLSSLLRASGLEVVMTRESDEFVSLDNRAHLANDVHGDLFISIHCNSARNRKLRGIETYTLNTSSDRYSLRLAARENSASEKGVSDLQFILADLATKANTEESQRLASRVQHTLVARMSSRFGGVENLGTKEALFYVLLGVRMPAVLVETSFLSHADEERRLASQTYQEEVARAIATGVQEFLGERQRVAAKVQ